MRNRLSCALCAPIGATILAVGLLCESARAADTDFAACDGYGAPSASADGITKSVTFLGIHRQLSKGDTTKSVTLLGADGVAACDAALADPQLRPEFWMRRVTLLRARAMHHLAIADPAQALADLDAAGAQAKDRQDRFYLRSVSLGLDLIRAYALRRSGRMDQAVALAARASEERTYSADIAMAALVAIGPDAPSSMLDELNRRLSRVDPAVIDDFFQDAMKQGRFAEAVALHPQDYNGPPHFSGDLRSDAGIQTAMAIRARYALFRLSRRAQYAYALAALGRGSDARAELQAAQTRFDVDSQPLPPARNTLVQKMADAWAAGLPEMQARGKNLLDGWAPLIDQRISGVAAQGTILVSEALAPTRDGRRVPQGASGVEEVAALFALLPDAETEARAQGYRSTKLIPQISSEEGQALQKSYGNRVIAVRAGTPTGSIGIIEDMALLKTCEATRAAGLKHFAVASRISIDLRYLSYIRFAGGAPHLDAESNEEFSTVEAVMFDDPPVEFAPTPWRVFDAAEVCSVLAPYYIAQ